jgi:hypothetical protein
MLSASELAEMRPSGYLVKGVLPETGVACIYGRPGAAKSFLALDLASKISDGKEWFGHRVTQCNVMYLCLEGQDGLVQRIQAYQKYHGEGSGGLVQIFTEPFSLLNPQHIKGLIKLVEKLNASGEYYIGAIMIDTLNAASHEADENSSADMGKILEAVKQISSALACLVILIHHSGKDTTKGLRGHSSLLAAADVVIEVTRDSDIRQWTRVKAKDGLDGGDHPFGLSVVELFTDSDGDPITSCVVVPREHAADSLRRVKLPTGGNQRIVYDVARELIGKTSDFGHAEAPATSPCIRVEDLVSSCYGRLAVESRRVPERVRDAITGLVNKGCLMLREGWLWLP